MPLLELPPSFASYCSISNKIAFSASAHHVHCLTGMASAGKITIPTWDMTGTWEVSCLQDLPKSDPGLSHADQMQNEWAEGWAIWSTEQDLKASLCIQQVLDHRELFCSNDWRQTYDYQAELGGHQSWSWHDSHGSIWPNITLLLDWFVKHELILHLASSLRPLLVYLVKF